MQNPIILADYPDPDIIRVEDTYYMVSTTMHFMPGCVILRSYDLIHWETAAHVYRTLDDTPGQKLEEGRHIYGKGMWAASLRVHQGTFYVCFVANDTGKTYLYTASSVNGPWSKRTIAGFYHDCSLLFDDDGRTYLVSGNMEIRLTELAEDLSGPKPGGLNRVLVQDRKEEVYLGYEGAHLYKINGRYVLFLIHMPKAAGRRTQACFIADSLEGEFAGGDIFNDDMGFFNSGVAQGGIVDTPQGDWYAMLFQDYGALGRIPVLVPFRWEDGWPVFPQQAPLHIEVPATRPGYVYRPLYGGDDFQYIPDVGGRVYLKEYWEWNHNPADGLWSVTEQPGVYRIRTDRLSSNLVYAVNTLTQRTVGPQCEAEVTLDGSALKDGDFAGLCLLISSYGFIALTRQEGQLYLVMRARPTEDKSIFGNLVDNHPGVEYARMAVEGSPVRLKVRCNFVEKADTCEFYYMEGGAWHKLGVSHSMVFKMDMFVGARVGLFLFSTREAGGRADFSEFAYSLVE
jgi:beta-xylosidase